MALTQVNLGMLDDTGSLGLGTTSPSTKLHVKDDTTTLTISDTGSNLTLNDEQAAIHLSGRYYTGTADPDADEYSDARIVLRRGNTNGYGGAVLAFENSGNSNAGLLERMRIDSSGRVTMPYQPSFHAYANFNLNHGTSDTKYVWNLTRHNIGSHYDTSNGRFTAPIDGRYYFNVAALQNVGASSYYTRVWLYKNGSVFLDGLNTQALQSGYGRLDIDAVVEASAGDYFETYFVSNNGSAYVYATYSWFSGHLLG